MKFICMLSEAYKWANTCHNWTVYMGPVTIYNISLSYTYVRNDICYYCIIFWNENTALWLCNKKKKKRKKKQKQKERIKIKHYLHIVNKNIYPIPSIYTYECVYEYSLNVWTILNSIVKYNFKSHLIYKF